MSRSTDQLVVPAPNNPMGVAREFVAAKFTDDEYTDGDGDPRYLLRFYRGDFLRWSDGAWRRVDSGEVENRLYSWLEDAEYQHIDPKTGEPERRPWRPNRRKMADLIAALTYGVTFLRSGVEDPAWISEDGPHDPGELLVVSNGVLHMPSRELIEHTPDLFTRTALPYAYDPDAPPPERWLQFLDEVWGDDDESKQSLQEMLGYLLSRDTRQQMIVLIYGPAGSGKGTIGRIAEAMLGEDNVHAPSTSSLGRNFGLQPLIGRTLAIISDARIDPKRAAALLENLLAISGDDKMSVPRKYQEDWEGRLGVRFMILTNELPKFHDASAALMRRLLLLRTVRSFADNPDTDLDDKLRAERTGILNWALDGYDAYRARGRILRPESTEGDRRELADTMSPGKAFVRDWCDVGAEREILCGDLFWYWCRWCDENGRDHPGTVQSFGVMIRAAVDGLDDRQVTTDDGRLRAYVGIDVRPEVREKFPRKRVYPRAEDQSHATARDYTRVSQPSAHANGQTELPSSPADLDREEFTGGHPLEECIGCGRGVHLRDADGAPRHRQCSIREPSASERP